MDEKKVKAGSTSNLSDILLISACFAAFILTFFPVWKKLFLTWSTSDQYSHGFFIVPISFYIIWDKKEMLSKIHRRSSWWGFLIIVLSLCLYLFASFAEIITLASISMVLLLAGVVFFLFGYHFFKAVIFPLFFLLFMIPVPTQIYSYLTIPLQLFVSQISTEIAYIFNVPIYLEGNVIHLPGQTLQVVQACSGLRSITTLLTLCAVVGYLSLKSNLLRMILFLFSIPTAIFVNILRVLLMIIAFYFFKYDLTADSVHSIYGMIIFVIALAVIIIVNGILLKWDDSTPKN